MNTKAKIFSVFAAAFAVVATIPAAATPSVGNVAMGWDAASREATISYTLSDAPAVVTLDIVDSNGDSVGGRLVGASVEGDVFRKVSSDGAHQIKWHPATGLEALPAGGVRAVVTAWPLDDTPDYMVVSLAKTTGGDESERIRYYPSEDFLPGGLHENREYKSVKIVMRKIAAKGVEWQMGTSDAVAIANWTRLASETPHQVALTNNYYIAVFETTHAQHVCITGGTKPGGDSNFAVEWGDRPVEQAYYLKIRGNTQWPTAPAASSVLGKLRDRTGLDFDLPSEAEWEFAARAGQGDGVWGDGTPYAFARRYISHLDANGTSNYSGYNWFQPTMPGRGMDNGGQINLNGGWSYQEPLRTTATRDLGTAVVGTTTPNSWGIYEMHGNVSEMTLDWYKEDISALGGAVCQDTASGRRTLKGGTFHSFNGGGDVQCRASARQSVQYNGTDAADQYVYENGYRLCCRNGLK